MIRKFWGKLPNAKRERAGNLRQYLAARLQMFVYHSGDYTPLQVLRNAGKYETSRNKTDGGILKKAPEADALGWEEGLEQSIFRRPSFFLVGLGICPLKIHCSS